MLQGSTVHILIMEKGLSSLEDVLEAGSLEFIEIMPILKRVGECLMALHAKRLVHCDVKPSNFVQFRDGCREIYKLVDLESCTKFGSVQSSAYTPQYCPPEMARASSLALKAHPGYDVFSYGLLCMHVLTGVPYWSGHEPDAILSALCAPDFVVSIPESLSSNSRKMLKLCLASLPGSRKPMRDVLDHRYFKLSSGATTMLSAVKVSACVRERECVRGVTRVCWQEGLGDVKRVVRKESAGVKRVVVEEGEKGREAVEDAAEEVLDGMTKDSFVELEEADR